MTSVDLNITYIAVKNLSVVWRKSQRQYNERWAKEIADNFDPDKFEAVSVTQPNGAGVYHIIEGQHRKGAVEMLYGPNEKIPCRIISEADPSRAAEIWLGINQGRKKIRPVTEFLVAVEAKRELETAINKIVRSQDYRVVEASTQDNGLSAVGALRKIYLGYGDKVLARTLHTCRYIWGSDPQAVQGGILLGMSMFINEFSGHIDFAHLKKSIVGQYSSPFKFMEAARFEADRSSESLTVAMSELLRMKYNRNLKLDAKKLRRKDNA